MDASYIMSTTASNELIYINTVNCSVDKDGPSKMKSEKWESISCVQCWHHMGVLAKYKNADELIVCKRISIDGVEYTISGDSSGVIRLFNFPVRQNDAKSIIMIGHDSAISDIACVNKVVISIDNKGNMIKWSANE